MARRKKDWARMPSTWINEGGLRKFVWSSGGRSTHLSALMCLAIIVQNADDDGFAGITYDTFVETTGMGRTLIAKGLTCLDSFEIITRPGKSNFHLTEYDETQGWAKFPFRAMYRNGAVTLFQNLKRRLPTELDALKLLFLIAARRDQSTNSANITYEQITALSGIRRDKIISAISLLAANFVVSVDTRPSSYSEHGVHNAYRLQGIDPYNHRGTTARKSI